MKVLYADDRAIELDGYYFGNKIEFITVGTVEEAITVIKEDFSSGELILVITDVAFGVFESGYDILATIKFLRPELPVFIYSRYINRRDRLSSIPEEYRDFLNISVFDKVEVSEMYKAINDVINYQSK